MVVCSEPLNFPDVPVGQQLLHAEAGDEALHSAERSLIGTSVLDLQPKVVLAGDNLDGR